MNDLQRKSFELLQIFVAICEKWNIPYYLVCGSALGAVKYGGFIPWDDDIDVGLLRPDYQRFLEIASGELPDWCFLQNYKTEKYYSHTFTKLRNSNTTFIEEDVADLEMNHGIGSLATEFRYTSGKKPDGGLIPVDYAKIAEGYGLKSYTCRTTEELEAALEDAKEQTKACLFDLKVIPKTMTDGYGAWWNVGIATTSEKDSVNAAYAGVMEGRSQARIY